MDAEIMAKDTEMQPEEYRSILAHHGLTQAQGSELWGVIDRSGQRYATGERPIPQLVARVMRISLKRPKILDWLRAEAGI